MHHESAKHILITGSSSGIGGEIARHLAPENRIFIHCHRSREQADGLANDIRKLGGEPEIVQADLSTDAGCTHLATVVSDRWDRLDVLINNAGSLVERRSAVEIDRSLLEQVFALNVYSTMRLSSLCIPLLLKGTSPCIINITSIAVRHGGPSATAYGAAKGAIDAFTRGLAHELAPRIRVNAIAPGVIQTRFHAETDPEKMNAWRQATPLKTLGEPRHIAMAIPLLIDNTFMTGETIDINGGLLMR